MRLFEGLLMAIKVIQWGWIIKISLLVRLSSHDSIIGNHRLSPDFTTLLRMINIILLILIVISCFRIKNPAQTHAFAPAPAHPHSHPVYHLRPPLHLLPSPQSLQLWLNIPAHSHPPPQWLAIIWMSHSIWNWDTWMNIIGYFPINPFEFKTPNSGSPPASVFMRMASTVLLTSDPCWRHVMGACLGQRVDI